MSGVAKVGDIAVGVCSGHLIPIGVSGVIVKGESTVLTNGIPTAAVGDIVCFSCGHVGVIVSGTSITTMKGKKVAMIGSNVVGAMVATIVSGSSTVIAN